MHFLLLFLALLTMSCQQYGLLVHQQRIDATYLASTNVGSPDPRRRSAPFGQMLVAEWWIPEDIMRQSPKIVIDMVFKDFTTKKVEFPITTKIGYRTYSLLNKEFKKTKGFLAYKATIVTGEGQVYREWKHQFWFNVICLDEEKSEGKETLSASSAK